MMRRLRIAPFLLLVLGAGACATKGQIQRLETQLAMREREQERRDSAAAAMMMDLIRVQQATLDSLESTRRAIALAKGESSAEVMDLQRSILALQENINASNRRLNEFTAQLDARQMAMQPQLTDSAGTPIGTGGTPSAMQMLEAGNAQLNRGAWLTARTAYQELLVTYPTSSLVPDAKYGIAQSYESSHPDSAVAYFREVAEQHKDSPRAASAMFKLGSRAQDRGDVAEARRWFEMVVTPAYRSTPEYPVAQQRLRQLP